MDIDQFQKLNEALATNVPLKGKKSGSGGSIGLLNVNERIKMTYGNDYGIKIFSAENVGTNVEIILKSIKKKPTL
jgi:two-component system sensor histidine kinase YesM